MCESVYKYTSYKLVTSQNLNSNYVSALLYIKV